MKPAVPKTLPIKDIKWEPLIPRIGSANRSLAHYDGLLKGIHNPRLMLSPLTAQEAELSSRIEGTIATVEEVMKYEAGEAPKDESRKQDILEIRNYRRALWHATVELKTRPFSLNLIKALHEILLKSVRGQNKGRGRFRTTQNWIGRPGSKIEDADFVPPEPQTVMPLMDNWEKYYHSDRPDPLVQLAVIHAQFETIHPFLDGNGRLGRMLVPIFLYEKKLMSHPAFYLSAYIEEHRDEYIARLRALGNEADAWNRWIGFFLKALDEQAKRNADKVKEIMSLYEKMKVRFHKETRSQYAVHLLDAVFQNPIFTKTQLRFPSGSKPSSPLVAQMLNKLQEAGVLKIIRKGSGRRPHLYKFAELVKLCGR